MSHDPGDEDRRALPDDSCPFCGVRIRWNHVWRTAVAAPFDFSSAFDAEPLDARSMRAEILTTCDSVSCKASACQFSREQGLGPDRKEVRAERRHYVRQAGLQP